MHQSVSTLPAPVRKRISLKRISSISNILVFIKGKDIDYEIYIIVYKKTLRFVLKPLSFVPAIFVMYMIFRLSAQDGVTSDQLSLKVSHKIVVTADKLLKKILRKNKWSIMSKNPLLCPQAGACYGIFYSGSIRRLSALCLWLKRHPLMLVAGLFCVGFAAFDEYHQSFVKGRGRRKKMWRSTASASLSALSSCGSWDGQGE